MSTLGDGRVLSPGVVPGSASRPPSPSGALPGLGTRDDTRRHPSDCRSHIGDRPGSSASPDDVHPSAFCSDVGAVSATSTRVLAAGSSSASELPSARVVIVLVTYYGDETLPRLWDSVRRQDYPPDRYELLVVQNGARRAALQWFRTHAPGVRVIVSGGDFGYAGGAAIGLREAIAAGADYAAVITEDVVLDPGWLREVVRVAERDARVGAVQGKIVRTGAGGERLINTWGNELHFLGVGYPGGDGLPDRPLPVRSIGYASGAGVLFRVAALAEVGVFDAELFMYHEDIDLSWRLRLAGYDVVVAPAAVLHHPYRFGGRPQKFYFMERNRLLVLLTHYRLRTLALLAPALLVLEAATFAYAAREGWGGRRAAVWGFFLRPATWSYVRRKRRAVQATRRVRDADLARSLTARFDTPQLDHWAVRLILDPAFALYWRFVRRTLRW